MAGRQALGVDPEISADLRIDEVTVFEDRAQVVRRGGVRVPAGNVTLRTTGVAPVLSDRTMTATILSSADGVRVSDLRARRELRPQAERQQTQAGELERLLKENEAARDQLEQRLLLTGKQRCFLAKTTEQALADLVTDASWDRLAPDQWRSSLSKLSSRERDLRDQSLDLGRQGQELAEESSDLQRRAQAAHRPDLWLAADILTELEVASPGLIELELSYIVPLACWRPQHTARLGRDSEGASTLSLATDACVWQCCGEDWSDVRLCLSTQRPALGFEPPLLGEDRLLAREKPEMVVVARDQEIRTTGLGAAAKVSEQLPGIDDGGEPLSLSAAARATVPSDGRPYRVAISEFADQAIVESVLVPELAQAVINRVSLVNRGSHAILAGPVDLIAENGLVGRSPVLYVAPGERFALGFGPDPAIRVTRDPEQVTAKPGALSRHVKTEHTVTLMLSNISQEEKSFTLTERIPVSEVEEVRVSFDSKRSTPGAEPDANGHLTWHLCLAPGGHQSVCLGYTVRKLKKVRQA